jgi:TonB family protein
MKQTMFGCGLLWLATSCFGQTLCPKHIETPIYPPLARVARIQGNVTLKVTIDANGNVYNVEVADDPAHQAREMLVQSASNNMMRWTFEKPPAAPFIQLVVYQYKFDRSLPANNNNPITQVHIDLPDRVTVLANDLVAQPGQSKKK